MARADAPENADWRGLTAVDPRTGRACLSLLGRAGEVHRFALLPDALRALAGAVGDVLDGQPVRMNVHPDRSSGSPARDVSIPLEGENT